MGILHGVILQTKYCPVLMSTLWGGGDNKFTKVMRKAAWMIKCTETCPMVTFLCLMTRRLRCDLIKGRAALPKDSL